MMFVFIHVYILPNWICYRYCTFVWEKDALQTHHLCS